MKHRALRPILLVLVMLAIPACLLLPGGPGPGAVTVRGTVSAGPTCPVVTNPPDPACADRPVAGAVLVFAKADGGEVGRATSAADGSFAVALAPGTYLLTAQPVEGLMGTPAPIEVTVLTGQPITGLQVSYDTGIR